MPHNRNARGAGIQPAALRDPLATLEAALHRRVAKKKPDEAPPSAPTWEPPTPEQHAHDAAVAGQTLARGSEVISAAMGIQCPRCLAQPSVWCFESVKGICGERRAAGIKRLDRTALRPGELGPLADAQRNASRDARIRAARQQSHDSRRRQHT